MSISQLRGTREPRARGTSDFDKILIESVDEGLLSRSKSVRHLIFYYLEKDFSLKNQDIPQKLDVFSSGLGLEKAEKLRSVDAVALVRKKAMGKIS
jgi:hypothetical protein